MKLAFFGEKNTDNREQILDNLLLKANKDITFNLEDHSIYARGVKFDSKSCLSFYHENATGEEAYCKVTIDKTNDNGYGILIYGRRLCYIMTSGTSFTTSTYNQFLEIGSDYNNQHLTRCLNIKPVVNEKSSTITLYVTMGSYSYMLIVCAADVKFESSNTNFTNITGFIQCKSVNTGSNNLVTQTPISNSNIAYRLLLSKNGTDSEETDVVNKYKNLLFNPSTETLTSTRFAGYLDGHYINALTDYNIATKNLLISAQDTLNLALGKLEYKINYVLDDFVTLTTDLEISGKKTFTSDLTLYSTEGDSPRLIFQRSELNLTTLIDWNIHVNVGNLLFQKSQGKGWLTVFQINYNNDSTFTVGMNEAQGFMKIDSSNNHVLLGGGGHKAISDFLLKSEFADYGLTLFEKTIKVTTEWLDTGIEFNNTYFKGNGTYVVLLYCYDSKKFFYCYYSGIMSVSYLNGINHNSPVDKTDEILLHCSSHDNSIRLYLRTFMENKSDHPDDRPNKGKLLIASSSDFTEACNITFKFKKLI